MDQAKRLMKPGESLILNKEGVNLINKIAAELSMSPEEVVLGGLKLISLYAGLKSEGGDLFVKSNKRGIHRVLV